MVLQFGGVSDETVKYGREFCGTGSESDCSGKDQKQLYEKITNTLSRQRGRPTVRNPQLSNRKQKSGHRLQMGARHQDRLADWPSVVTSLPGLVGSRARIGHWPLVSGLPRIPSPTLSAATYWLLSTCRCFTTASSGLKASLAGWPSTIVPLPWLLALFACCCLFRYRHGNWVQLHVKTKLRGLSPRTNYTDRATASCRRS
jgi:hypothetical protein